MKKEVCPLLFEENIEGERVVEVEELNPFKRRGRKRKERKRQKGRKINYYFPLF